MCVHGAQQISNGTINPALCRERRSMNHSSNSDYPVTIIQYDRLASRHTGTVVRVRADLEEQFGQLLVGRNVGNIPVRLFQVRMKALVQLDTLADAAQRRGVRHIQHVV